MTAYPTALSGPAPPPACTPVRDFTPARPVPVRYAAFEATPQLAVLSTRSSTPADWPRAGQALQRVLLTAAARGVASTPLTQPLETADAWLARDPRSGIEEPQMILRLGYGQPVPACLAPPGRRSPGPAAGEPARQDAGLPTLTARG